MYDWKLILQSSTVAVFLFEAYIKWRQYQVLSANTKMKPKSEVAAVTTEKDFQSSRAYSQDKMQFGFLVSVFDTALSLATIHYDLLPMLWDYAWTAVLYGLGKYYGPIKIRHLPQDYEITHSIVWILLIVGMQTVIKLPFGIYREFVLEERHGFNKQTLGLFISDFIKGLLISVPLISAVLGAILWVINKTGERFYVYVWLFLVVFQLVMIFVYPTFIQPLFNKVEPLEESELKTQIEEMASQEKFPLKKLFVIDGSKRSNHSNAYLYGFGDNKRIVLFDTLIKQLNNSEIVAVLCHEIGHWKHSHALKMMAIGQVDIFLQFYLFSLMRKDSVQLCFSFGFSSLKIENSCSTIIQLMLFMSLLSPIESLVRFFYHMYSRHNEYQADEFAAQKGKHHIGHLKSALIKLSKENKSWLIYDPIFSAYYHSHPGVIERVKRLNELDTQLNGKSK
ncbi:hypothetical protein MP228_001314 [Amoeboaphelidium protococcarum]|nr:hypothetical protein MP228_001314 [Amoeboaphelidium protococcarum]